MSTCERFSESFSGLVDNVLPPEQRLEVEAHLVECAECRLIVARLYALRNRLRSLTRLPVSADFDMILRTRIKLERRANYGMPIWGRLLPGVRFSGIALVVILLLSTAMLVMWRSQGLGRTAVTTPIGQIYSSQLYEASVSHSSLLSPKFLYLLDKISLPGTSVSAAPGGGKAPQSVPETGSVQPDSARPQLGHDQDIPDGCSF